MSTVIKVENISKQYRLGDVGTGSLAHDLNRSWHKIRGKEDPYLKIGEANDRTVKASSDYVWALKDINFDVQQGEVLGIIGRNGAGKSTLLKILSRTTMPTTGNIKIKGRIASLLEVGTGFHPELSGRDNIFLNGAILGMTKREIKSKFDEIVDFAGVERYIDTPVKRYSSGMYVRLAFGVAAHLEPEILIVDEVLAVGDMEFQKKALGKMKDVSTNDGRTVLFVSHNMSAVRILCRQSLLLVDGGVDIIDNTANVLLKYSGLSETSLHYKDDGKNIKPYFSEIKVDSVELERGFFSCTMSFLSTETIRFVNPGLVIYNEGDTPICGTNIVNEKVILNNRDISSGTFTINLSLENFHSGKYKVSYWLGDEQENFQCLENIIVFEFSNKADKMTNVDTNSIGSILPKCDWKIL